MKSKLFWLIIILVIALSGSSVGYMLHLLHQKEAEQEAVQLEQQKIADSKKEYEESVVMCAVDEQINVYEKADAESTVIKYIYYHMPVDVVGEDGDFYVVEKESFGTGYVLKDDLSKDIKVVDPDDTHWEYKADDLSIEINRYYNDEDEYMYWVAEVATKNPDQDINTMLAGGSYETCLTEYQRTSDMAEQCDAVFAINGDAVGFRRTREEDMNSVVIHNGEILFDNGLPMNNMCALYADGSMKVFRNGDLGSAEKMVSDGVRDVWFSYTTLLENGSYAYSVQHADRNAEGDAATAIGQVDKNHFIFIVVDGDGKNRSFGVNSVQMADLMKEAGAKFAYSLDGGGSSTMYFDGMVLNSPADGLERKISDIVYVKRR